MYIKVFLDHKYILRNMPSPTKTFQSITTTLRTQVFSSNTPINPPRNLVSLACTLYTASRTRAPLLKPHEEVARECACCVIAAERLTARGDKLPRVETRPPCTKRAFNTLKRYLDSVLAGLGETRTSQGKDEEACKVLRKPSCVGNHVFQENDGQESDELSRPHSNEVLDHGILTPAQTPSRKRTSDALGEDPDTIVLESAKRLKQAPADLSTPGPSPQRQEKAIDPGPDSTRDIAPTGEPSKDMSLLPGWVPTTASHLLKKFGLPGGCKNLVCDGVLATLYPNGPPKKTQSLFDLAPTSKQDKKSQMREKKTPAIVVAVVVRVMHEARKHSDSAGRQPRIDPKIAARQGVQDLVARKVVTGIGFGGVVADAMEVMDDMPEISGSNAALPWLRSVKAVVDSVEEEQASPWTPEKMHGGQSGDSNSRLSVVVSVPKRPETPAKGTVDTYVSNDLERTKTDAMERGKTPKPLQRTKAKEIFEKSGERRGLGRSRPPMTHPSVDWLSPERKEAFSRWKTVILKRIDAVEKVMQTERGVVAH